MSQPVWIEGLGLAGVCTAWEAWFRGQDFVLTGQPGGASWAALGLVNPLTGPRLSPAWPPLEAVDRLRRFYRRAEEALEQEFWRDLPVWRPFVSEAHRSESLDRLVRDVQRRSAVLEVLPASPLPWPAQKDFGGLLLGPAGRLDVPGFLQASLAFFARHGRLLDAPPAHPSLKIAATGARLWTDLDLPAHRFQAVKGEMLVLQTDFVLAFAVAGPLSLVPGPQPGEIWAGATHEWDCTDSQPTAAGRAVLEAQLPLPAGSWRVIDHRAGVRPAVRDHFPVTGLDPRRPGTACLGGLGSRGVAQAPELARLLFDQILEGRPLPPGLDLRRFLPTS